MIADLHNKIGSLRNTLDLAKIRQTAKGSASIRHGYIGGQGDANLGDEAMLEAARRMLPAAALTPIGFPRQERRLERLGLSGKRYFDSAILGGGTLINEYVWTQQVRTALLQGLPVASLGTGVGSCGFGQPARADLREWKALLADFAAIGVRGPLSKQALDELGVLNVEVVGDLALSLCLPEPAVPSETPKVAVNVTRPPSGAKDGGDYSALSEMKPILCELIRGGWGIVPIAMHRADVEPMEALMRQVGQGIPPISVLNTAEEFFAAVGPCRCTLAVRLHTSVLSCCAGVPPLMLGYRDKCQDFMQSMELTDWYISLDGAQPGEITERARALAVRCGELRRPVWERAQAWSGRLQNYVSRSFAGHAVNAVHAGHAGNNGHRA